MYLKIFKPTLDFVIAFLVFTILLPVFLFLYILLRISLKGSPLFFQARPGKNHQEFKVIKFRTMNNKRDAQGNLLPDEDRITPTGKFIRKTSLDEIPQLLNVIKGDMSLVGPRPLLKEYLPLYSEFQDQRHKVKPGITGWAQVNGRNAISWEQKFEYDVWYVNHLTFLLDCKIIWLTFKKVFKSEGISQDGHATMPLFTGRDKK